MDLMYLRTRTDGDPDSGYLSNYEADFEISMDPETSDNDFEIKMALPETSDELFFSENEISSIMFVEGTEYGGIVLGSKIDIEDGLIIYTGKTWRGLLSQYIIEPPEGEDYLIVSGNIADILRALPHHPMIEIEDTEYTSDSFQFDRYITVHKGIMDLLSAADPDLRFSVTFRQTEGDYTGVAALEITTVQDLTALVEVSQDFNDKIGLTITRDHNTPRHLICLGQGELHEREVIHLYADENWDVSQTEIPGAFPVDIYDYGSSEDLLADGMKKYAEIISNHKQIDASISDLEVKLGDVISARDHLTDENVQAEISSIIYKCEDYGSYQKETFEYKTKVRI